MSSGETRNVAFSQRVAGIESPNFATVRLPANLRRDTTNFVAQFWGTAQFGSFPSGKYHARNRNELLQDFQGTPRLRVCAVISLVYMKNGKALSSYYIYYTSRLETPHL